LESVKEEALLDALNDHAISFLSPTGEIRTWNRGAERIFGYSAQEAIRRNKPGNERRTHRR
jgi:PAS domain S-box-containing protein